jgi:O-antigen/teichoic acid export membrane protein
LGLPDVGRVRCNHHAPDKRSSDALLMAGPSGSEVDGQADAATRRHLRGSSLLLVGRLLALAISLATDIVLVRYLAKSDYGIFAWTLSIASLGASASAFGLDKAIGRFVAIYEERGERSQVAAVIVLMTGIVAALGAAVVALVLLGGRLVENSLNDGMALGLLAIMIFLAPLRALGSLSVSMMAIFAGAGAIFVRRYLIGPGVEFIVVMATLLLGAGLLTVGAGYVAASAIGLVFSAAVLIGAFREQGTFTGVSLTRMTFPVREVLGFAAPLLSSDFVLVLRGSALVLMLEALRGFAEVAEFRAVLPIARQNLIVLQTFTVLYTPVAARLFARGDRQSLNSLYWRSSAWIALVTLPLFIASFALAEPVTVLLFGERYAEASLILAVLSIGYYGSAVLGFNSMTLRVAGIVRFIVAADVATVLVMLPLGLVLISVYGALGAALSLTGTLVLQQAVYQSGLRRAAGVEFLPRRHLRLYGSILSAAAAVLLLQLAARPPVAAALVAGALATAAVVVLNRSVLDIAEVFPELGRLPFARRAFRRSP